MEGREGNVFEPGAVPVGADGVEDADGEVGEGGAELRLPGGERGRRGLYGAVEDDGGPG